MKFPKRNISKCVLSSCAWQTHFVCLQRSPLMRRFANRSFQAWILVLSAHLSHQFIYFHPVTYSTGKVVWYPTCQTKEALPWFWAWTQHQGCFSHIKIHLATQDWWCFKFKEGSTNVDEGKDELDVMGSDKKSEIEEHNIKVLMYVNIKTPPPLPICVAGHITKPPGPKITVQGPFAFQSNISYNDFLSIVAKGMGMCSANCIIWAKMWWRFNWLANAAKRLVTPKEGYEPMITTILRLAKSKDYAITVSIPPPTKHVNDVVSFVMYATSQLVLHSCRFSSPGPWFPLTRTMVMTDNQ